MMKVSKLAALNIFAFAAFLGVESAAKAADPVQKKADQAAPAARGTPDPNNSVKGPSPNDDLTVGGTRGQIDGLSSVCDVAPPCPKGCMEDASRKACVDKPGP